MLMSPVHSYAESKLVESALQIEISDFSPKIISGVLRGAEGRPVKLNLVVNGKSVAGNWGIPTTCGTSQTFRFNLSSIWNYVAPTDNFQIKVEEQVHHLAPPVIDSKPKFTFADLAAKLDEGHVFNEKGGLQLSKTVDTQWQNKMFTLFDEMSALLSLRGIKLVVMYGTLLGAHRGGNFIGHDHDFDAGYISAHSDPEKVGSELVEVAELLSRRGYRVSCKTTCIWVTDPRSGVTIDIFQTYFDANGKLQFPFGVCGIRPFTKMDFQGYVELSLADRKVLSIANTDALVEYIYGPHWRTPNPGHNWDLDRTENDRLARPTQAEAASIYWTDFHLHSRALFPSPFGEHVAQSRYLRRSVIDLGCGNGRDTVLFAQHQSCVIGIDNSSAAIETATNLTRLRPGGSSLSFVQADVADWNVIVSAAKKARTVSGKSGVTFYGRFLLHAITGSEQWAVLSHVAKNSEKGDTLALEFRTTSDEPLRKAHRFVGRRFIDSAAMRQHIMSKGYKIAEFQEGTGLSPYMNENPHLCRLIAVKL